MPTTRTFTAEQPGPTTVSVSVKSADVLVITSPDITTASVEVSTPADDGPSADAVRDAILRATDYRIRVDVLGATESNVVVGGGVAIGGPNSTNMVIGMVIADTVNFGTVIGHGTRIASGSPGAGGPITVTVRVPENSSIVADIVAGDVDTTQAVLDDVQVNTKAGNVSVGTAQSCRIKTMSGDIRVDNLTGARHSDLSTMAGDINLYGADGAVAYAKTMRGNVRYARNMDVAARTMSGTVRGVDR